MTMDAARDSGGGRGTLSQALVVLGRWLPAVLVGGIAIGAWEGLVAVNDVPSWKLPPPSGVAVEMWEARSLLAAHTWVTLAEVLAGFAIALIAGVTLAGLISISSTMARVLYPPVIASETVPWIVIAPLLLIWVGYGMQHKVIVVALIALFPIVVNTADGLRSADPDMVSLLRALGASRRQIFAKVQVPSSLPSLFSGIKIAVTASVIGAVVGEWVGSSEGLGYLAIRSKSQFLTDRVLASIFLLCVMGIVLFLVAALAERRLLPWRHDARRNRVAGLE